MTLLSFEDLPHFAAIMPTEEELKQGACERHTATAPYALQNLPLRALALSIDTDFIPLSPEERDALIGKWRHLNNDDIDPASFEPILENLAARVDPSIRAMGGGAFIRLGTRSPKDSYSIMDEPGAARVTSGAQALFVLTDSMERVYRDLDDARRAEADTYICVRRWVDIQNWQELRCFVEDGKLAGITQYADHEGMMPKLVARADEIEKRARAFLTDEVMPALESIGSYTADLIFDRNLDMTLLEVNPPISMGMTYPGLFREHELDGSFLIVRDEPVLS